MSLQRLLFYYGLVATLLVAVAWLLTDASWTQGDTVIGVAIMLIMLVAGWHQA